MVNFYIYDHDLIFDSLQPYGVGFKNKNVIDATIKLKKLTLLKINLSKLKILLQNKLNLFKKYLFVL